MRKLVALILGSVLIIHCGNTPHSTIAKGSIGKIDQANQLDETPNDSLKRIINEIDEKLGSYHHVQKDIYDKVIEPEAEKFYRHASSVIEGFYDNEKLVKIVSTYEGDRETLHSEYYLQNGQVIFVKKEKTIFNPPKWSDNPAIDIQETYEYFFIMQEDTPRKQQLKKEIGEYEILLKE